MNTVETITEETLRNMFDDMLDDMSNDLAVAGYTWTPSTVLKTMDPIAYECELRNYADSLRGEYLVPGWND